MHAIPRFCKVGPDMIRMLLVEDDPFIRDLTEDMAHGLGVSSVATAA